MTDLPSWLQAGAAVIALGLSCGAIFQTNRIAVKARDAARRDAATRSKIVAAAIVTDLELLQGELDWIKQRFIYPQEMGQIIRDSDAEIVARNGLQLPSMIERSLPRLHWLEGSAAETMMILVALVLSFNKSLSQMNADLQRRGVAALMDWLNELHPHLDLLIITLSKAKHEVGLIHFGPEGYPAEPRWRAAAQSQPPTMPDPSA